MKKGFTLIELLGIIVILGLIVAFTVPSLINLKKNEEQNNQSRCSRFFMGR